MGIVDKVRTAFTKKSIDDEIDAAFDDSSSYSKRVLEGSSAAVSARGQLSDDYSMERQPEPRQATAGPPDERGQRQYADPGMPAFDDPLEPPAGIDRVPPRRDEPLQVPAERTSTDEERREFFSKGSGGTGMLSSDVKTILLEIKDLRTQNEHILDVLKNIQDRLRGY